MKCPSCGTAFVHPSTWSGATAPEPTPGCSCFDPPAELVTLGQGNAPAHHLTAGEPAEGDSDADET